MSMYENLPFGQVGFIKCNQPWSGHYTVTPSLWAMAHTAQFAQPGWQYIDQACGYINGEKSKTNGTFVTLKSPDNSDYSVIIETVDAKAAQEIKVAANGFASKLLHVWASNLKSNNENEWFVQQKDIVPANGKFSLTVLPGYLYSLTTTTGQGKVDAVSPPPAPLTLPYVNDFDSSRVGGLARYFSDLYGAFEVVKSGGGRSGNCLRQMSTAKAISWKNSANRPYTMLGNLKWTNYSVTCDVLWEQPGAVDVIGRITKLFARDVPSSYFLRVSDDGTWSIMKTHLLPKNNIVDVSLASGRVGSWSTNTWHNLVLTCDGGTISAKIDGATVGTGTDASYDHVMVGLGVVGYHTAQFDNFKVAAIQ